MADYSKWDEMARAEEMEEKLEKERKRAQNKANYFKEQEERKVKYLAEQAKKNGGKEDGHGHGNHDGHGHSHGGDEAGHSHAAEKNGMQPLLAHPPRRPACGCGYADVEEMKRAAAEAALQPQLSTEEKNAKKVAAVYATREHGKQLFQAGDYAAAFAVYERGVLIVSGVFGLEEKQQKEMTEMEIILNLNMAACKLKLKEFTAAIDQCRMALQLDPQNVKAHFRCGVAYVGMGEYDQAKEKFTEAQKYDSKQEAKHDIAVQLAEIKRLQKEEREKVNDWKKQLEQKLTKEKGLEQLSSAPSSSEDDQATQIAEQVQQMQLNQQQPQTAQ